MLRKKNLNEYQVKPSTNSSKLLKIPSKITSREVPERTPSQIPKKIKYSLRSFWRNV